MDIVNELGQESSLVVDNSGSLKVSTSTTSTQFRKTFDITEENGVGPIEDNNSGGIIVEGNGTAVTIPNTATGFIGVFPEIFLVKVAKDAKRPNGSTFTEPTRTPQSAGAPANEPAYKRPTATNSKETLAGDRIGKGLGFIKIKDFDPNSYATHGRINVVVRPIKFSGPITTTAGGKNPVFRNYSYHIVGFNDGSNELTEKHYGSPLTGANTYPTTTLQAYAHIDGEDFPFPKKPMGTYYADVVGESQQNTQINVSVGGLSGASNEEAPTSELSYSNISNAFPLAHDNYFIIFNNNHGAKNEPNPADTIRQPDLGLYITMSIFN